MKRIKEWYRNKYTSKQRDGFEGIIFIILLFSAMFNVTMFFATWSARLSKTTIELEQSEFRHCSFLKDSTQLYEVVFDAASYPARKLGCIITMEVR